jgi:hypothetical protein
VALAEPEEENVSGAEQARERLLTFFRQTQDKTLERIESLPTPECLALGLDRLQRLRRRREALESEVRQALAEVQAHG